MEILGKGAEAVIYHEDYDVVVKEIGANVGDVIKIEAVSDKARGKSY